MLIESTFIKNDQTSLKLYRFNQKITIQFHIHVEKENKL